MDTAKLWALTTLPWTGRLVAGGDVPRGNSRWAENRKASGEGTLTLCDLEQDLAPPPLSEPQILYCQKKEFPGKRGQPRSARELGRGDYILLQVEFMG